MTVTALTFITNSMRLLDCTVWTVMDEEVHSHFLRIMKCWKRHNQTVLTWRHAALTYSTGHSHSEAKSRMMGKKTAEFREHLANNCTVSELTVLKVSLTANAVYPTPKGTWQLVQDHREFEESQHHAWLQYQNNLELLLRNRSNSSVCLFVLCHWCGLTSHQHYPWADLDWSELPISCLLESLVYWARLWKFQSDSYFPGY